MTHLFLCQIGPVQSFIAAGRRTQDLYVGSRLLSELARAGLNYAKRKDGFEPVFPILDNKKESHSGIPHRFAFFCREMIGEQIRDEIRNKWIEYAHEIRRKFESWIAKDIDTFERQKQATWLEFNWVAVEYNELLCDEGDYHKQKFLEASIALAQRRLLRGFAQVNEPSRKCTLTGAESALNLDWTGLKNHLGDDENDILFRPHEYLGTTAFVKRLAQRAKIPLGIRNFPRSTSYIASGIDEVTIQKSKEDKQSKKDIEYGYLAVLHMDGDKMGEYLSSLKTLTEHQQFSQKLAHFADETVPKIIGNYERSHLIYAGGDDVLALLPLRYALDCAYEIRQAFEHDTACKMSAGIAITPHDFPLDLALDMARKAEEKAKEGYGRDAIVVTEAHGTGTIREAGGNWEIVDLMNTLIGYFADDTLSGKLGYDMLEITHHMYGDGLKDARLAELTRIIKRRLPSGWSNDAKNNVAEPLAVEIAQFAEVKDENGNLRWQDMAHWVILARFIAKPTKEKAGA